MELWVTSAQRTWEKSTMFQTDRKRAIGRPRGPFAMRHPLSSHARMLRVGFGVEVALRVMIHVWTVARTRIYARCQLGPHHGSRPAG